MRSHAGSARTRTMSGPEPGEISGAISGRKRIAASASTHRIGTPTAADPIPTRSTSWSSSYAGGPWALP